MYKLDRIQPRSNLVFYIALLEKVLVSVPLVENIIIKNNKEEEYKVENILDY